MIKLYTAQGSAAQEQAVLANKLANPGPEPELMVWRYTEAAIILGCNQRRRLALWQQVQLKRKSPLSIVSRRAGGGAVLAGPWMLSATLLVPAAHPLTQLSLPASFELFGRCWAKTLAQSGVASELAQRQNFASFNQRAKIAGLDWICFAGLSHGELLDPSGCKLVGLAQIRKKQSLALVSGLLLKPPPWRELLLSNPQEITAAALQQSVTLLPQLIASVAAVGNSVPAESLVQSLQSTLDSEINLLAGADQSSIPS